MDGQTIVIIGVTILVLLGGGYIAHLVKQIKELFVVLDEALLDSEVSREELARIFEEAKDVGQAIMAIYWAFARKKNL